MNNVVMMGRLTRDPEVRYGNNTSIAKFSLAVDRRFKRDNQPTADFFNCTAFGKTGEFVEKYLKKGTKIAICGELQNNNWTDKDGNKRYDMQIIVNQVEFAESKAAAQQNGSGGGQQGQTKQETQPAPDDFLNVDDGVEDSGIPFA